MNQEGADAHGPSGSRTERAHGGRTAWNPPTDDRETPAEFSPKLAEYHRKGYQERRTGGKS